jgi:Protein of unknown function (DUF2927)
LSSIYWLWVRDVHRAETLYRQMLAIGVRYESCSMESRSRAERYYFLTHGMTAMLIKFANAFSFLFRPLSSLRGAAGGTLLIRKLTLVILTAIALAGVNCGTANAENPDISTRRAAARTDFTNEEIRDGFFKIAFSAELQLDKPMERVRKFDEPVRIFVIGSGVPDRRAEIAGIVDDIRTHVNHLDVAITNDRATANFVVRLVAERNLERTIRSLYGSDRAKRIQESLSPQCLSGIGKDERYRIRRAEVILPVDAGDFTFYDCAYEEMLQGLGAINDDRTVPWTMFNDEVQMGFFDVYDQYLLNILYDPRIRPGMTKDEVNALLPEVLSTARTWVRDANLPRHANIQHR